MVTLNPCHWRWLPWGESQPNDWTGPKEHTWAGGWLFFTVRVWVDDGSW